MSNQDGQNKRNLSFSENMQYLSNFLVKVTDKDSSAVNFMRIFEKLSILNTKKVTLSVIYLK